MIGSRHLCGDVRVVHIPGRETPVKAYRWVDGERVYLPEMEALDVLRAHLLSGPECRRSYHYCDCSSSARRPRRTPWDNK